MVLRGGLLLALCLVFSLVFVAGEWEVNLQATLSDNNVAFQTLTSSSCSDDFDVYDFPALSIQNNYSIFYSSVGAYNLMVDCWDLPLGANKDRILNLTYYADSDYTGDLNITWDSGIFNRTFSAILNDYGADNSYTVLVSSINMSANNFYNVSVSSTTRYFQLIFDYDLYYCGDGIINGLETCEGTNFSGATCATYGYDTGSLSCNSSCLIVSSGCSNDNEDDDTGGGGGGGGTPTPTCTDGCNAGEKRCSNGYAQSCGNYDNDSCLEWPSLFEGDF